MNTFFYIILFVLGTMFGSFASVIIYRLKSGEKGILTGRSHCSSCNKILKTLDLIPIVSWIINKGKCKKCKNKISKIYPLLEISTGLLFALIGYFLIDFSLILELNFVEIIKLLFFLTITFFSIIYIFYDILFLEIPDLILALAIIITIIIIILQTLLQNFVIIETLPSFSENLALLPTIYAILLSISIIIGLYIIIFKELHEVLDIAILLVSILALYLFKTYYGINLSDIAVLNSIIGTLGIFIFFFFQILVSRGKWMGGGDLRIAILVGLFMGVSLSFSGMMITYIVGSIIGIGMIIFTRLIKTKNGTNFNSEIPFGPFIAAGFFITLFYSESILNFIKIYLS